jgi:hypothetical protein
MLHYRAIPKELEWFALDLSEHGNVRSFVGNDPVGKTDILGLLKPGSVGEWGSREESKGNCFRYACNDPVDGEEEHYKKPPGFSEEGDKWKTICEQVKTEMVATHPKTVKISDKDTGCGDCFYKVLLVLSDKTDRFNINKTVFYDHWYRQGNDGKWSHKPGNTPIQDGVLDPEGDANERGYPHVCAYFCFMEPGIDADKGSATK